MSLSAIDIRPAFQQRFTEPVGLSASQFAQLKVRFHSAAPPLDPGAYHFTVFQNGATFDKGKLLVVH